MFHTFSDFDPKKSLVEIIFSRLSQLQPARPGACFEKCKFFFKKKFSLFIFLEFEHFFCLLTKKTRQGVKKTTTNTEKSWRKKFVEKLFFKSSSDFQQKFLNNWTKNTRKIAKTAFNVFSGTILGRLFGRKKICPKLFGRWEKILDLAWIFGKFVKSVAYVCRWTFWEFFGEKPNCLGVFGLRAKVSIFWQKILGRVAKTTFYVSRGTILGFFLKRRNFAQAFWSLNEIIGLLELLCWQICQNCSLRLKRNVWKFS